MNNALAKCKGHGKCSSLRCHRIIKRHSFSKITKIYHKEWIASLNLGISIAPRPRCSTDLKLAGCR